MKHSAEKTTGILSLVALFSVNLAYMADLVIVPAADSIYGEFASAPVMVLNFVLSGPQLITIFSALLAPLLMKHFSKKKLIVSAFGIFVITASICGIITNIYFIALMRAIVGFCGGILMSTAMAFIIELFRTDEAKCGQIMGYYNSSMNLFGVILPLIAGVLCVIKWNYVFFEYLIGIPLWLIMVFCLPETGVEHSSETDSVSFDSGQTATFPVGRVVSMLISVVALGVLFNFITYESSMYLTENKLGNATVAGIMSSVGCIAGILAGVFFGKLYEKLHQKLAILIYLIMGIGYFGICFIVNAVWFGIFLAVMGFAYGLSMPYYFAYATTFVPDNQNETVVGLITSCVSIGTFLCTYIATAIGRLLHIDTLLGLCPVYVVLCFAGIILTFVANITINRSVE